MSKYYREDGDKIILNIPHQLKDHIKEYCNKPRFNWNSKTWSVANNLHNHHTLLRLIYEIEPFPLLKELQENPSLKEKIIKKELESKRVHPLPLWEHQKWIVNWILHLSCCIIAGEMRTGKTRGILEAIREWASRKGFINRVEVWWISPKSAKKGLKGELQKLYGSIPKDLLEITLVAMTYEEWQKVQTPSLCPQVLVFDEVHKIKTPTSNRGKLATEVFSCMEDKWGENNFLIIGASGTPAPNNPTDWYNQANTICPAWIPYGGIGILEQVIGDTVSLGSTLPEEKKRGLTKIQLGARKVIGWNKEAVKDFQETYIEPIALTIFKDEVMDLPKKVHKMHRLRVSPKTKKAIQFIRKTAERKADIIQKSLQISDGFLYKKTYDEVTDKTGRETAYYRTPKEDRLIDLLKEAEKVKPRVCVFGSFKATVDTIERICLEEGWNVLRIDGRGWQYTSSDGRVRFTSKEYIEDVLKEFDNSQMVMQEKMAVVGHPQSMATGLELSACPHLIYYSHTNNGEAEFQSIERAHSFNMDKELGLTIHHLIHLAVDELIIDRLVSKKSLQSITMGELKDYLDRDIKES